MQETSSVQFLNCVLWKSFETHLSLLVLIFHYFYLVSRFSSILYKTVNLIKTSHFTMSLGIPSLKHKPEMPDFFQFKDAGYGVSNPLHSGWNCARTQIESNHPLESVLKNFRNDQMRINNSVMLNAQGPAAPLIQAMELRAVKQVGRHPFLPSSNFQLDVLTGRDMEMDFDDFLNTEEFKEVQAQPHIVMENFPLKPLF